MKSSSNDPRSQVESAYQRALARKPTADESRTMTAYSSRHGLANGCRLIFNSSEFMFVD